jgi:hypothetical protein
MLRKKFANCKIRFSWISFVKMNDLTPLHIFTHPSRGEPPLELEYALEAETSKFFLLAPLHAYFSILAAFTKIPDFL